MEKALKMLMDKKKSSPKMSESEKSAKISVVQDLRHQAMEKMGEKLKGHKMAPLEGEPAMDQAKADLSGGEKAEAFAGKETPEEEALEGHDQEAAEHVSPEEEQMSPEELDYKIKCLEDLKKKKEEQSKSAD